MIKLYRIFFIIVCALFFSSCGEKREVKIVANNFLEKYYSNKFQEAYPFSTEGTKEFLIFKEGYFALNPYASKEPIRVHEIGKIVMRETAVPRATCYYTVDGEERKINLVKQEGKWLVDMSVDNPVEDAAAFSHQKNVGGFASAESEPVVVGKKSTDKD